MNNNCIFAGDSCCLCDACQAVRKAAEEAEKVTLKETNNIFHEMEKMLEECKSDNEG